MNGIAEIAGIAARIVENGRKGNSNGKEEKGNKRERGDKREVWVVFRLLGLDSSSWFVNSWSMPSTLPPLVFPPSPPLSLVRNRWRYLQLRDSITSK